MARKTVTFDSFCDGSGANAYDLVHRLRTRLAITNVTEGQCRFCQRWFRLRAYPHRDRDQFPKYLPRHVAHGPKE